MTLTSCVSLASSVLFLLFVSVEAARDLYNNISTKTYALSPLPIAHRIHKRDNIFDKFLDIFTPEKSECFRTLPAHFDWVTSLELLPYKRLARLTCQPL